MNILGKTMIFKSEYGYSTTISTKNQEGQYERMYIAVQFPKGIELENKTLIDIKDGFLSFYKSNNGISKLKAVILNCDIVKTEEKETTNEVFDEELPF